MLKSRGCFYKNIISRGYQSNDHTTNYIIGIEVKLEYNGNTLKSVEEKCQKVEEVFKGLYDPMTRA